MSLADQQYDDQQCKNQNLSCSLNALLVYENLKKLHQRTIRAKNSTVNADVCCRFRAATAVMKFLPVPALVAVSWTWFTANLSYLKVAVSLFLRDSCRRCPCFSCFCPKTPTRTIMCTR